MVKNVLIAVLCVAVAGLLLFGPRFVGHHNGDATPMAEVTWSVPDNTPEAGGKEWSLSYPSVPEYVVFAGDTVRFNSSERYERMDRELLAFTYMHSNSLLMLKRSSRYFPQVEPILEKYGIPDDFKYLMAIESNLEPKSVSGAGAAGLWQFTKGTGRDYGLEVASDIDERYNTVKATEAACRYLKDGYESYGDWMTVAASYNAGFKNITTRLDDQRQSSALNIWVFEETSRYMYRLMAAKMMFTDPSLFGFNVKAEDCYPYFPPKQIVTIPGNIGSLVDFAEKYGITYSQLKNANLWLRDSKLVNRSQNSYRIAIPDIEAENDYYSKLTGN